MAPASEIVNALTSSHPAMNADSIKALIDAAIEVKSRAYCPYSRFRVGAAILACTASSTGGETRNPDSRVASDDNPDTPRLFTGVNVENASYPVGVCAERCAFATAVAAGFPRIIAIAVSTDIDPPASPCGMCRQFMREFVVDENVCVVMMGKKAGETYGSEGILVRSLRELLPMSFGPADLPLTMDTAR